MERYEKNIEILKSVFKKTDYLEKSQIENYPDSEFYKKYFKFCQDNLEIQEINFGIKPAIFYFRNYNALNACAMKCGNHYAINICNYYFQTLKNRLINENFVFEKTEFENKFNNLTQNIPIDIGVLMFQCCTLFTYYHELAHLIQFKNKSDIFLSENSKNSEFNLQDYVYEFDADLNGAQYVCFHIIEYIEDLEMVNNMQFIENIISLGLSSILISRLLLEEFKSDSKFENIYFYQKSHPHSLVRAIYILEHFINNISPNISVINLDEKEILKNAFLLTELYFNNNSLQDFTKEYFDNPKLINDHIENLESDCENFPELVRFQFHKYNLQ